MNDKFDTLIQDLNHLTSSGYQHLGVFGEDFHGYQMNKPFSEDEVADFEAKYGIHLPTDYRQFLIHVGNGGAGPYYGLFKLGEMDDRYGFEPWPDFMIGQLSKPFPHHNPWNDLTGKPEHLDDDYDEQLLDFDSRYYSAHHLDGAIPICHLGCNLRQWLVITGSEVGNIWCDDRANYKGLYPLQSKGRNRVTFFEWYRDWLDDAISKLQCLKK